MILEEDKKEARIINFDRINDKVDIVVPRKIKNKYVVEYKVSEICEGAFNYCII